MKSVLTWIVLGSLFLIPFLPLYVADGLFFPFITGKAFAFRILVEAAAAAWFILLLTDTRYRPQKSWILYTYGALVVWMFIADLFAVNPHKAFWSNYERMDGWVTLIHVFLLFVVAGSVLQVKTLWRKWWLAFLSGSALVCGYGLLQILGIFETHQGGRVDATFGNAAYLPAYLLFGIGIALWQGMVSRGWMRAALFILAGAEVFILLFTATRGALFGLVGALIVGALIWGIESGKQGRTIALGVLIGLALVAGTFFVMKDTVVVKESLTLSRLSAVFSPVEALQTRFTIWGIAGQGVAERPLTGYGHEGFNYVFNTYYQPSLFAQEQWFDRAHNVFLDWLIAGGAPALFLFVILLGYGAFALFRKAFSKIERVCIVGIFIAYTIQGLVVFDNLFTYVPLALLFAYIHVRIATPIPALERIPLLQGVQSTTVAAVVLPVSLLVVWMVNMPGLQGSGEIIKSFSVANDPLQAMTYLKQAAASGSFGLQEIREQMVTHAVNAASRDDLAPQVRGQVVMIAVDELQKELVRVPGDARLRLQYTLLLRAVGNTEAALQEADKALSLSPRKQTIHLDRGLTLWQAKRFSEARDAFYTAYQLDTRFALLAAYAAAGDIVTGNKKVAQQLLATHYDPALLGAPSIILAAYQEVGDTEAILEILRARVSVTNGSLDARFQLAGAYAEFGQTEEARKEIQGIIANYPEAAATGAQWLRELDAMK